jgi:hypothetical protein
MRSLRTLFGLCDHRWRDLRDRVGLIEHSVGLAQGYGEKIVTGYSAVRECERCGEVRSFKL